ncbi:Isoleucine--tRNA ligase [Candidatus Norongarragalina meridionalis]|nr:Isoleucine--tRNA ligase [Candidatus Norongarragalina meridionalis]
MRAIERYDSKLVEEEVRTFWKEKQIPQGLAEHRKVAKKYFVLDGPPYVNGTPHVGHVKTTACKDVWTRFKYMQGYDTYIQPGFDCHGLPVEVVVQKELGVQTKQDIDKMGIDKFDAACLQKILNNEKVWMDYYQQLGAWRAYFEPYFTYKKYYIESAWWTAKTLHEKGFLVEGETPTFWCAHCETVLSGYEVSDSYKDLTDPSLYVKFRVKGAKNEYLVAWTTTPWTLISNVALFVHPKETYVKAKVGDEIFIMAKARLDAVLKDMLKEKYEIIEEFPGERLSGTEYEPLLDVPVQKGLGDKAHRVYLSVHIMKFKRYKKHKLTNADEEEYEEFVTMSDGSGIVHCAPGHGASDHYVGKHYGLPAVSPVDEQGNFTSKAGNELKGKFVKAADKEIIERLDSEGKLLHAGKVTHSYPLCWRCKNPLIYRLTKQWYFKIDDIKEKMLDSNESVNWMPSFGKEAFGNWLEQSGDWCISRQRYWAIPLPIWVCNKCNRKEVIGSVAELREKAEKDPGELDDLHRHTVDSIKLKCVTCGGSMERIKDVFDVWYDSGISPWASLGYPFRNKELFESMYPVDLINESQDQIRGWFYTLMFASMATHGKPAFKNVAMMGWVVDEKGEKMSKSLGNVIPAKEGIEKVGADAIRLYYCWEIAPWDVQKFSLHSASEVQKALNILWNSFAFFKMYAPQGFRATAPEAEAPEDLWILSRLNSLAKEVPGHVENFEFHHAGRKLMRFIVDDYSRWYVKLTRDRASDAQCANVMYKCLVETTKMLAPFCPFITEYLYQELKQYGGEKEESVHYCAYPKPDEAAIDSMLEERMAVAMRVAEAVNSLRREQGIKLRWPVRAVIVTGNETAAKAVHELQGVMINSLNSVSVTYSDTEPGLPFKEFDGGKAFLDPKRDEELLNQALFRELVRAIQSSRKQNGFNVSERVSLTLYTTSKASFFLQECLEDLKEEVGAKSVTLVPNEAALKGEFAVELTFEDAVVKAKYSR